MNEIILLEIISLVSFLFSLLTYFLPFTKLNMFFLMYLWTILVSFSFVKVYKKKPIYKGIILLLIVPLIFKNTFSSIAFVFLTLISIYIYINNGLLNSSYLTYGDKFKKSLYLFLGLLFISFVFGIMDIFISNSVPFIIIYFISTIVFIRSLRHIEHSMNLDNIKSTNRCYIIGISILSFILILEEVRDKIFLCIKSIYIFIVDIIFKILYYPLIYIGHFFNRIIQNISNRLDKNYIENLKRQTQEPHNFEDIIEETKSSPEVLKKIIDVGIKIGLIIVVILILYWFVRNRGQKEKATLDYIEEREYIVRPEKEKKKKRKRILKPKDLKGQVRYYYKKYLIKLKKSNIPIESYDSSLEVNNKAEEKFQRNNIKEIREIYIDTRYGRKEVDESTVKKMKDTYKNI